MAVKLELVIQENMLFSPIENLNIENYHYMKKLTVGPKIPLTWSISLHVIEMSQNSL